MQTQLYTISPQCTTPQGQQLYLTATTTYDVTANTQILDASGMQDASQLWAAIWQSDTDTVLLVSSLLSTGGKVYAIDAPFTNAPVVLVLQQNLQNGEWNYCSSSSDRSYAIQLYADTAMTLNVDGSGTPPYTSGTPVLAWEYPNASPNNTWAFTAYGQPDMVSTAKVRAVPKSACPPRDALVSGACL
jgi:hypothetical protein